MRIGMGYDVHRLTEGRDLILGGVKIPYEKGLLGHSDADVLLHAVMDALLGAAALGDIGKLFPDNDPAYEGISSLVLLDRVMERLKERGFRLGNADVTVLAQRPKLAGRDRYGTGRSESDNRRGAWLYRQRGGNRRPCGGSPGRKLS